MNKADKLLNEINDYRENFDDSKSWREYIMGLDYILDRIPGHLNRKDEEGQ